MLSPHHPRDRLRPQRVDREEQRGDGRRRPRRLRRRRGLREEAHGHEEEQDGVGRVKEDVREVIAEGPHPPHRVVQAEGQPRDGEVLPEHRARRHPPELRPAQSPVRGIAEQPHVVVPAHEPVAESGQERDGREESQEDGKRLRAEGQDAHRPS